MKLNILTLNWNGKEKLKNLYPGLKKSLKDLEWNWLIKDNASTDGSIDLIKAWADSKIKLFEYSHNNDNFAEGCNYLFNKCDASQNDNILFLNNDIIFNDNKSIKNILYILNNDNDVGIVGAKLNYTNTNKLQHAGVIFDSKYNCLPFHYRPGEKQDFDSKQNREFQAITGAVMAMKAKTFIDAGCFDPEFIWSFDDIDLCLSVKYNLKKKVVYCGHTNIYHDESHTLKKNPMNKLFIKHNVETFKRKWDKKYSLDHNEYLKNPNYNLYKVK